MYKIPYIKMEEETQKKQNNELSKKEFSSEFLEIIKKESLYLIYLFITLVLIFKIVFYQEEIWVLFRTVLGFIGLFVIPGFALMYYWSNQFDFLERLIFGTVLGIGIVGLSSYYLTLFKISLHWQYLIIPLLIILASVILMWTKDRKNKKDSISLI